MKKLIVTDLVQICGSDLIGPDQIWHLELRMRSTNVWDMTFSIKVPHYLLSWEVILHPSSLTIHVSLVTVWWTLCWYVSQFQYHIRCPPICNDPVIIVADPFIAKDSEHMKGLARGTLNKEERIWSLLGPFIKVHLLLASFWFYTNVN
jgi:hypothetical protein